jgi:hypothetical protein
LCERKDKPHVLECFRDSGLTEHLDMYYDRECVRKLFDISFGLDSMNYGNTIVRKQLLEAKHTGGTPNLKKIVSDVVGISEDLIPIGGYRQFTTAIRFLNNLGLRKVHIVTGGEVIGQTSRPVWDPESFKCDAVIFSGRFDKRIAEATFDPQCQFCINFNMSAQTPDKFTDLTRLFDSHVSKGGPVITNTRPIADLYWEKIEEGQAKKLMVNKMKSMGISSGEIEALFDRSV